MIRHLLLDVDNTLYSPRWGLERAVGRRVREAAARWLRVSYEDAAEERRRRVPLYGTTLEWLRTEHGMTAEEDIEAYFRYVHPEDEADALPPDPALRAFLANLPCPVSILTNAPREHADRIFRRLGVEGCFTEVFDIRRNAYRGKPRRDVFEAALGVLGTTPAETLFVDDVPSYIEGYAALGGRGVLMDWEGEHGDWPGERARGMGELAGLLG